MSTQGQWAEFLFAIKEEDLDKVRSMARALAQDWLHDAGVRLAIVEYRKRAHVLDRWFDEQRELLHRNRAELQRRLADELCKTLDITLPTDRKEQGE